MATTGQFWLLQRLRWRLARNSLGVHVRHSPIRLAGIVLFSAIICGGLLALSYWGFRFLRQEEIPLAGYIVELIFDIMFLALAVLLVFSTGIILFSSLFSSAESTFLLTTPLRVDQLFLFKFQTAVAFSSWAFLLLGGPILVGYGLAFEVPWPFYVMLPLFFLGFVLLPGSLGALLCLLIVNLFPQRRREVVWLLLVLLVLIVLVLGISLMRSLQHDFWNRDVVKYWFDRISIVRAPLLPSHWTSVGLLAAVRGQTEEMYYRLALIWSNGLFFYVVTAWTAKTCYRRGYNRLTTGGTLRRRYRNAWPDRLLSGLVGFLDPQIRLLIVKDFRTFRRDPAQWAQIVIFTGLICLYFANTRRFFQEELSAEYQNGLSLLNLTSVALLLCAYTGRFIFPLLSLEGKKFWILGLLPLKRERLLWGKFMFSATGALLVAEFLVIFGDVAMGIAATALFLHMLTIAVVAMGLSGLAVGLGAVLANFRETDPSKIAVGFGGTMNLLISVLFLALVISMMAVPWHLIRAFAPAGEPPGIDGGILAGLVAGMLLGVLATIVPLRFGCRSVRHQEF